MLPYELFRIVASYLSRGQLQTLAKVSHLRSQIDKYFHQWAQRLIAEDTYFAELPLEQVVRYLQRAHIEFIPDEEFIDFKVDEMLEHLSGYNTQSISDRLAELVREVYTKHLPCPRDVPRWFTLCGEQEEVFKILSIIGLSSFFDERIGYIPDVAEVNFTEEQGLYLLYTDGSIEAYYDEQKKAVTLHGSYQKISEGIGLTTEGKVLMLSPFYALLPYPLHLPLVQDIAVHVERTATGYCYDFNCITREGVAHYVPDRDPPMKLASKASKVACFKCCTFVLSEQQVLIYREGLFQSTINDAIDLFRRHLSYNRVEIVVITKESHIVHSFDDSSFYSVQTQPRLSQELVTDTGKYILVH